MLHDPRHSVNPPAHVVSSRFDVCKVLPYVDGCIERQLRLDKFKKNLQDGTTANDYFSEIVILSKLL